MPALVARFPQLSQPLLLLLGMGSKKPMKRRYKGQDQQPKASVAALGVRVSFLRPLRGRDPGFCQQPQAPLLLRTVIQGTELGASGTPSRRPAGSYAFCFENSKLWRDKPLRFAREKWPFGHPECARTAFCQTPTILVDLDPVSA